MEIKNKSKKPFKFGAQLGSKKTKWSNSSFWLDFDSDNEDRGTKIDVVRLAGYKRAISNFVNIVTGKNDIFVKYNDNDMSYTDGKTVTISSKLSDGESFDTTVGLALHEGSHCLLTDFNVLKKLSNTISSGSMYLTIKDILNVIEDRRIDSYIYKNAPGYRGYYEAMYKEYFYHESISIALKRKMKSEVTLDNYMFHIINIANPNRDENALPGLKDIYDMIDLRNIDRIKNTQESLDIATNVYYRIQKELLDNPSQDQDDDQSGGQSGSGNGNSQVVIVSGSGSGSEGEPMSGQINIIDLDDFDSDSDNDAEEGSENESGNGSASESDNESENESNSNSDSEKPKETPAERKERVAKEKAEKAAQKQAEKEEKEIKKNLNEDIKAQRKFIRGEIKKGKVSKKQSQQIDAMTSNDVYIERVGETRAENGTLLVGARVDVVVVNGITQNILDGGLCRNHYSASGLYGKGNDQETKAVHEGMQLGVLLGKKLKTRDEERSLKTTRCAKGAIDKRLIAELGFGAENVFNQVIHYTVKPVYVHISIDASGSMGGDKWRKSLKTAVAIAKACSMVSNIHVCIDIRGEVAGMYGTPLTWVVYDSKRNNMNHILKHFPMLQATSSTPESLCYESIKKQIIRNANGNDSFFITFSDGEPSYYTGSGGSYSGETAYQHCRNQIKALKNANINVLGYFISDHSNHNFFNKVFKAMYGTDSAYIDVTALNALSRSINSLFERKQTA